MEEIKILRERTGAGMLDCKQAWDEAGGNLDTAVAILRKKGIAKAAKREGRDAKEGLIKLILADNGQQAALVELDAETDFVVRSEQFQKFVDEVAASVAIHWPADAAALLACPLANGTVKEGLDVLAGVTGEKLAISRLAVLKGGTVAGYIHAGGKIGALVSLEAANAGDLARDLAMQVAAADPKYLTPAEVEPAEIAKEKEIYAAQLTAEGKSAAMLEKIIEGKLNKYYEAVCLVRQEYIKDDKKKVSDILAGQTVRAFVRFAL